MNALFLSKVYFWKKITLLHVNMRRQFEKMCHERIYDATLCEGLYLMYKEIRQTAIGERLLCWREPDNYSNRHAIAGVRNETSDLAFPWLWKHMHLLVKVMQSLTKCSTYRLSKKLSHYSKQFAFACFVCWINTL